MGGGGVGGGGVGGGGVGGGGVGGGGVGGGGVGGGGLGGVDGGDEGGEEGGFIPTNSRTASSLASNLASSLTSSFLISAEHSQVDGGVWNGASADADTAAAPTRSSMQRAASHLSRWAPLNLVTAAFFWGERLPCWTLARSVLLFCILVTPLSSSSGILLFCMEVVLYLKSRAPSAGCGASKKSSVVSWAQS